MMQSTDLIPASEVRALLGGVSTKTLDRYRAKYWHCGIHYVQPVQRVMYIKPMILDWILNRQEPKAHQSAMEEWLASNQNPKRSKRAS
jgi:hypothetical protein